MKYQVTVVFDTDIKDKYEFYDHLSEVLDSVDCNDLEIGEIEEV